MQNRHVQWLNDLCEVTEKSEPNIDPRTPGQTICELRTVSEIQTEVWYPPALCRASLCRSTDGWTSCEVQIMSPNILTLSVFCKQYELWNCRNKGIPRNVSTFLSAASWAEGESKLPHHIRDFNAPHSTEKQKVKIHYSRSIYLCWQLI